MLPLINLHTALRATRKQATLEAVPPLCSPLVVRWNCSSFPTFCR